MRPFPSKKADGRHAVGLPRSTAGLMLGSIVREQKHGLSWLTKGCGLAFHRLEVHGRPVANRAQTSPAQKCPFMEVALKPRTPVHKTTAHALDMFALSLAPAVCGWPAYCGGAVPRGPKTSVVCHLGAFGERNETPSSI